jgi:hypothetical protein
MSEPTEAEVRFAAFCTGMALITLGNAIANELSIDPDLEGKNTARRADSIAEEIVARWKKMKESK